ncbi:hypothetical protein O1O06_10825 [Grimontia hollisae]|uniref:hypothetical protein n=1 Tax=Grimontia hollisae TaxID=673 RepID=UPI0023DAE81D|nr:hypothetical protein [Grimontia hollisae]MDF2185264.1 hypothetical protein [Grimontia hollisae]
MELLDKILFVFGGQTIVLVALFSWLGKVQANRIQSREQARSQTKLAILKFDFDRKLAVLSTGNEPKAHVGKIQYEREYSSYAEIWDLMSPITHHLQRLYASKHSYDSYKIAFFELGDFKLSLGAKINALYPFIDEKVYKKASPCPQVLQKYWKHFEEHLNYLEGKATHCHPPSEELENTFGDLVDEATSEIHNLSVALASSIRARNEEMIVVGNAI